MSNTNQIHYPYYEPIFIQNTKKLLGWIQYDFLIQIEEFGEIVEIKRWKSDSDKTNWIYVKNNGETLLSECWMIRDPNIIGMIKMCIKRAFDVNKLWNETLRKNYECLERHLEGPGQRFFFDSLSILVITQSNASKLMGWAYRSRFYIKTNRCGDIEAITYGYYPSEDKNTVPINIQNGEMKHDPFHTSIIGLSLYILSQSLEYANILSHKTPEIHCPVFLDSQE